MTGVHAGWVLSRESLYYVSWSADAVENAGRQHRAYCYSEICRRVKEQGSASLRLADDIKPTLSCKHDKLANIPLMSYNVPIEDIVQAVKNGYFFLKIKIGSDPDKDGDLDKMLEWDKNRIREIHGKVKNIETPYTEHGHVPYYFDANGRYDSANP